MAIKLVHTKQNNRIILVTNDTREMRIAVENLRHDNAVVVWRGKTMSMGEFMLKTGKW